MINWVELTGYKPTTMVECALCKRKIPILHACRGQIRSEENNYYHEYWCSERCEEEWLDRLAHLDSLVQQVARKVRRLWVATGAYLLSVVGG